MSATLHGGDSNHELVVNEWPKGGTPGSPHTISASDSWNPSLDVNSKGEALVAYNFTGLINNVLTERNPLQAIAGDLKRMFGTMGNINRNMKAAKWKVEKIQDRIERIETHGDAHDLHKVALGHAAADQM